MNFLIDNTKEKIMPKKIDPITVEIIQSSLQAACDEMFIAMRKTAMSSIIYEVLDFGTAVTDSNGNIAASGAGIPAFIAMCDKAVQAVLNKFDDNNIYLEGKSYLENKEYKIYGKNILINLNEEVSNSEEPVKVINSMGTLNAKGFKNLDNLWVKILIILFFVCLFFQNYTLGLRVFYFQNKEFYLIKSYH